MTRVNVIDIEQLVQDATDAVAGRTAGRDRFGHQVLTQADIDRLPDCHVPMYGVQLLGKVAVGRLTRTLWQRLVARLRGDVGHGFSYVPENRDERHF